MRPLPPRSALGHVRVIDTTTGPVGGVATMVLADFGAEVIKVEPPGGDRFRTLPASALWLRGKQSITLDLHTAEGRSSLHQLVRTADVLVVGGPPGRAQRWGVDPLAVEALSPRLVHCSITGWGEQGPLAHVPGYVGAVAARAGRMMSFAGQLSRPGPVYAAVPVAAHAAAHGAVHGILSALFARDRTGESGVQRVTTSLLQALLPYDLVELLLLQIFERTGVKPVSNTATGADMPTLNYHPVRTKDGAWIQCGNLLEHLFLSYLDAIGLYGELLTDEQGRFGDSPALWMPDAVEHARTRILERLQEKTADEWMSIFSANGNIAAEPFATTAQALHHPELVANGSIVEITDPVRGVVRTIGAIASLSATPALIGRPAPRIGEHNDNDVVAGRAQRRPSPVATAVAGPSPRPLDGITIVEFAAVIAAPLGASMLADLGATVIRVEPIDGDPYRQHTANGVMTVKTTAGKRSICVDLKTPAGRTIAQQLIETADVLIHNYRPGVPERLGIGWEQLHAQHPALVWVAVTGYGPNGPSAHRPATHPVAGAAMGGAAYQAGGAATAPCTSLDDIREYARQLMRANEPSPDPNTAVIIASATLVALCAREQTGVGQAVLVDMLTANAHANADAFLAYESMPPRPEVDAEHFGTGARHRLYPARAGWVFLAITTDAEWVRFAEATDCRRDEDLAATFLTKDAAEWETVLGAVGVACVIADESTPAPFFLRHPQMLINGFAPATEHTRFGSMRRWGPLVTVNGGLDRYGPGVLAGEHTDAVLAELGYSPAATARMRARRIVGSEPHDLGV